MIEIEKVEPDIFVDDYDELFNAVSDNIFKCLNDIVDNSKLTSWQVWKPAWYRSDGKIHIRFLIPDDDNEFFFFTMKLIWDIVMKLNRISFNGKQYNPRIVRLNGPENNESNYFNILLPKLHLSDEANKNLFKKD